MTALCRSRLSCVDLKGVVRVERGACSTVTKCEQYFAASPLVGMFAGVLGPIDGRALQLARERSFDGVCKSTLVCLTSSIEKQVTTARYDRT